MCGINGILTLPGEAAPVDYGELLRTRDAMVRRGPDGAGAWVSPDGRVALASRRLAVIDPSPAGHQPMGCPARRFWIVFNGEIYNFEELRQEMEAAGHSFRSRTDTEVLLALYSREGPAMLPRLRGMFAFAIWDETRRTLFLARDPYGLKPLYYSVSATHVRFASQVGALIAGGHVSAAPDPVGLVGFLLWGAVPEPFTIRRDVHALPAGHCLRVEGDRAPAVQRYHAFEDRPGSASEESVAAAVENAVAAHLVADVPVGILLSAGLDSGMVAAAARRALQAPPTTLTVRFESFLDTPHDEGPAAAALAAQLGCRHVEHLVRRDELVELWGSALSAMDQPSIDGFNTYLVCQVAAGQGLKVVLSGLGGDELFGGYPSFRDVPRWCAVRRRVPEWDVLRRLWRPLVGLLGAPEKLAGWYDLARSLPGAYVLRRGLFLPEEIPALLPEAVAREGLRAYDPVTDASQSMGPLGDSVDGFAAVHRMESTLYLRNQLLRDSDWASMAHSVELRAPLVDVRLRETVAGAGYEPARSRGKRAVAARVAGGLPESTLNRPKTGFRVPVEVWLPNLPPLGKREGPSSRAVALRILEAFGFARG